MKDIHEIEAKTPEPTAQESPFEIIIKTHSPERRAEGGPVEMSIPCGGYFLCANVGDKSEIWVQGNVDPNAILDFLINHWGGAEVIAAALKIATREEGEKE
jgi:hypothetical protein